MELCFTHVSVLSPQSFHFLYEIKEVGITSGFAPKFRILGCKDYVGENSLSPLYYGRSNLNGSDEPILIIFVAPLLVLY